MIEIYSKTNTNYDKNGDITLDPTSCTYKDSEKELVLEHFQDEDGRWKYIDFENVIAAEENGKKKLYRIYNVVRSLYNVTAYARPIFYDLIDKVLIDVRPTDKTGEEALNIILAGTGFTGHSNISSLNTAYYVRKNIVESLIGDIDNSFLNRWGGEFYCENFDVYINDRIGADNGVRVEFGYNLNEIEEDINIEEVVTRIIPVGYNGITLGGDTPWVDSPTINKYTQPKMRVIEFSDVKVKESPDDEEGFDTIEEAREELTRLCNLLFENGIDKPAINYKIDMINLANTTAYKDLKMLVEVNKGDTVTCYIKHLDIDVKARVIDYERDLITGEYTSIELGNVKTDFFNEQADIKSKIDKILNADGTVNAIEVAGVLNAINVKMRAMKDIAQKQDIRALLCEDLDPESPTYGAMCYGTMGFMIASERTPDNRDWDWRTFGTGKGFFADLIVAGTMLADRIRGGVLESLDGSLQIDLREASEGIQFKYNGGKAIDITGQIIRFYDWDGTEAIGQIYSGRLNSDATKKALALGHEPNSYMNIGYKVDDTYYAYMRFDKYNIDPSTTKPISFFQDVHFMSSGAYFSDAGVIYGSTTNNLVAMVNKDFIVANSAGTGRVWNSAARTYFANDDNKIYADFKPGQFILWTADGTPYFYKEINKERLWLQYGIAVNQNIECNGDLKVYGTKNCIQETQNYGDRLFYAVEDCESYLTDRCMDIFTVEVTQEGTYERVILLDNIFKESVNLDESDYTVEIIKQGWGDYRIKEQTKDYFIVESDRQDFTFKYVVTAKRRGFEDRRLEEFFKSENLAELEDIPNKAIEETGGVTYEHENN